MGISDLDGIEIRGEQIKDVTVRDFRLPASVSRFAVDKAPRRW